jgi:hypothetical protein
MNLNNGAVKKAREGKQCQLAFSSGKAWPAEIAPRKDRRSERPVGLDEVGVRR